MGSEAEFIAGVIAVVLFALCFGCLGFVIGREGERNAACEQRGGIYQEVGHEPVCVIGSTITPLYIGGKS